MTTQSDGNRWCILTARAVNTLTLATSLADAGYGTWTPLGFVEKRKPRGEERREVEVPIMPTFVFANVGHTTSEAAEVVADLWRTANAQRSPHPQFSIFQYGGGVPLVGDPSLEFLRFEERYQATASAMRAQRERDRVQMVADKIERQAAQRAMREKAEADQKALQAVRAKAPKLKVNDLVTVDRADCVGLVGVVQGTRGHQTLVLFGGSNAFKIETWLLHPVHVKAKAAA